MNPVGAPCAGPPKRNSRVTAGVVTKVTEDDPPKGKCTPPFATPVGKRPPCPSNRVGTNRFIAGTVTNHAVNTKFNRTEKPLPLLAGVFDFFVL